MGITPLTLDGRRRSAAVPHDFNGCALPIDVQGKLGVHTASKFKAGPSDRRYAHRSLDRIVPERLRGSPISLFSGLAFPISANPVQIWTHGKGSGNII